MRLGILRSVHPGSLHDSCTDCPLPNPPPHCRGGDWVVGGQDSSTGRRQSCRPQHGACSCSLPCAAGEGWGGGAGLNPRCPGRETLNMGSTLSQRRQISGWLYASPLIIV